MAANILTCPPVRAPASPALRLPAPARTDTLPLYAGIGVVSTGHCHPKVVKAIQDQAANMIMAQQNVFLASKPMVGSQGHPCSCCARDMS